MKLEWPQKSVDTIMQYFEGFFYLQATVKLEFQRSQSFLSKIIFSFQWQLQASASLFTLRIKHWKYFSLQATTYYLTHRHINWTIWYQVRVVELLPSNAHARKIFMCATRWREQKHINNYSKIDIWQEGISLKNRIVLLFLILGMNVYFFIHFMIYKINNFLDNLIII